MRSEGASEERVREGDKRIGISVKEKYHCKSPYWAALWNVREADQVKRREEEEERKRIQGEGNRGERERRGEWCI